MPQWTIENSLIGLAKIWMCFYLAWNWEVLSLPSLGFCFVFWFLGFFVVVFYRAFLMSAIYMHGLVLSNAPRIFLYQSLALFHPETSFWSSFPQGPVPSGSLTSYLLLLNPVRMLGIVSMSPPMLLVQKLPPDKKLDNNHRIHLICLLFIKDHSQKLLAISV